MVPKTKKPAAGGGAAGFRKEPNSDWEEECRRSYRCPLGGGVGHLINEALREEVHRFVENDFTRSASLWKTLCCIAALL